MSGKNERGKEYLFGRFPFLEDERNNPRKNSDNLFMPVTEKQRSAMSEVPPGTKQRSPPRQRWDSVASQISPVGAAHS